jgi:hypothetical protein
MWTLWVQLVWQFVTQTATLAAQVPKLSCHNTMDKLVVATLLQSPHFILKKNTYPLSQRDMEWSIFALLAPPCTQLT